MNAVSPKVTKGADTNGLATYLISRSVLDAVDVADAIDRVQSGRNKAYGASLNVGTTRGKQQVCNIEAGPSVGEANTRCAQPGEVLFHFNVFAHSGNISQRMGESSAHRLSRAIAINASAPIREVKGIPAVLGDTADPLYPLYRDGSPPDDSATAATALFDLETRALEVYLGNARTSGPAHRFALP